MFFVGLVFSSQLDALVERVRFLKINSNNQPKATFELTAIRHVSQRWTPFRDYNRGPIV